MAGVGRAPKRSGRRNHHEPQRGDWVSLPKLDDQVLPGLPVEDEWSPRTVRAWLAWASDPATGMYGPAEIQAALDLAYVYERWVQDGTAALAAELRQRLDGLGLSPKGKQDRRWASPSSEVEEPTRHLASVSALRPEDMPGA